MYSALVGEFGWLPLCGVWFLGVLQKESNNTTQEANRKTGLHELQTATRLPGRCACIRPGRQARITPQHMPPRRHQVVLLGLFRLGLPHVKPELRYDFNRKGRHLSWPLSSCCLSVMAGECMPDVV